MTPFAEVIGDPIAQSKSPAIHRYWLGKLGLDGDYRRARVERDGLADYFVTRRADKGWRGCNVTLPHKEKVGALLDSVAPDADAIGAVNCVVREGSRLIGYNSDVDGIAAAIGDKPLGSRKVAVIGAGGAARAMLSYLSSRSVARVTVVARNRIKAEALRSAAPSLDMLLAPLDQAATALDGAALIVNASPLGMDGAPPMPEELLCGIEANARGTVLFDMVYQPLETEFLRRGAACGGEPVDGLAMLIGQARSAFERFYGAEPPADDGRLKALLTRTPESIARSK